MIIDLYSFQCFHCRLLLLLLFYIKLYKFTDYSDTGEYWRSVYETPTFEKDLQNLLDELKPLYKLLHGYVRKQLKKTYGAENFPKTGHIPAHLLG